MGVGLEGGKNLGGGMLEGDTGKGLGSAGVCFVHVGPLGLLMVGTIMMLS